MREEARSQIWNPRRASGGDHVVNIRSDNLSTTSFTPMSGGDRTFMRSAKLAQKMNSAGVFE